MAEASTPLVLFAHPATRHELEVARTTLGDTCSVKGLPSDPDERAALLGQAQALLVRGWRVPDEELASLTGLRLVQRVWSGVERIPFKELEAAAPECIFAGNPGPNAAAVAEHGLALYLDCAKRVSWRDREARDGRWEQDTPSRLIAGSRIGIVGFGAIGRRMGRAFVALGARVIGANTTGKRPPGTDAEIEVTDLAGLIARRGELDGIVLAAPATTQLMRLVDHTFLAGMKGDAILVNVARGQLVDEAALWSHLVDHPGFQAGIDAQWHYPEERERTYAQNHDFQRLDNVVITPHAAWNVPGIQDKMLVGACENVLRFLRGKKVKGRVRPEDYA